MALGQDSGGTGASRRAEAFRILEIIKDETERMIPKDANFVSNMEDRLEERADFEPTTPMIFWLRDIRDRLL